jgi:hypothetical protein
VIYVLAILAIAMGYGMNFGLWVQMELHQHEKSLSWLAGRIGSHPSLLCKWRAGLSNPKTEYFFLVCKEISLLRKEPIEKTIREGAQSMGIKF